MGRLIRIAIYAIIILALYYWTTSMMKDWFPAREKSNAETVVDTTAADTMDQVLDSIVVANEVPISNEEIIDGKIDYSEVDQTVEKIKEKVKEDPIAPVAAEGSAKPAGNVKPVPQVKPSTSIPSGTPVASSDGGKYMVMAGSYLLKANANKMVKTLKGKGFNSAKVVVFNTSEYHSVIAASYATEAGALASVNLLKKQGIECFVRTK
jgi:cell division septation protein DedD